jgi:hypothetical protein
MAHRLSSAKLACVMRSAVSPRQFRAKRRSPEPRMSYFGLRFAGNASPPSSGGSGGTVATVDAGPSASLAIEKRHTGCAQNFSRTSAAACFVESSLCGPTNGLRHRAAWTATSPFLNGSEQIPHVVSCIAILVASDFDVSHACDRIRLRPGKSHANPYQTPPSFMAAGGVRAP